jgi:ABC-type polysaccharide/polyol phosphate export permease
LGFVLTVWFFVTPICYPETSLPANLLWLYELNPIFVLVRAYREILLEASPPSWGPLGWLTLGSAMMFVVGFAWFYKLKRSFADLV